jgi:branched-chain amino acid transport system substrate-binding protein
MVGASAHTAILVLADAISRSGSTDKASLRDAIASTNLKASTGQISFNTLGEVQKDVQVQIVRDGNWHHHSVISDAKLLAPPSE